MTFLTIYLAIGILNAAVAYDQKILMAADYGWSVESVIEALAYVVLWIFQLMWWGAVKLGQVQGWILGKIWGA